MNYKNEGLTNVYFRFINLENRKDLINDSELCEIITNLILNFKNHDYLKTIHSISYLNSYLKKTTKIEINNFNTSGVNILLYDILYDDLFLPFYDNIIRLIISLININEFDYQHFLSVDFINHLLNDIIVNNNIRSKSNVIQLISLLITKDKHLISKDFVENIISLFDDFDYLGKTSIVECLIIIVDLIDNESSEKCDEIFLIIVFTYNQILKNFNDTVPRIISLFGILLNIFSLDEFSYKDLYLNFHALSEEFQIEILNLIPVLCKNDIVIAFNDFHWDYFDFVLKGNYSEELIIAFFNMGNIVLQSIYYSQLEELIEMIPFIINIVDSNSFRVKMYALQFLSVLIIRFDKSVPLLLKNGYMDILSALLDSADASMINVIIKSYFYLLEIGNTGICKEFIFSKLVEDDINSRIKRIQLEHDSEICSCFLSLYPVTIDEN